MTFNYDQEFYNMMKILTIVTAVVVIWISYVFIGGCSPDVFTIVLTALGAAGGYLIPSPLRKKS